MSYGKELILDIHNCDPSTFDDGTIIEWKHSVETMKDLLALKDNNKGDMRMVEEYDPALCERHAYVYDGEKWDLAPKIVRSPELDYDYLLEQVLEMKADIKTLLDRSWK